MCEPKAKHDNSEVLLRREGKMLWEDHEAQPQFVLTQKSVILQWQARACKSQWPPFLAAGNRLQQIVLRVQ